MSMNGPEELTRQGRGLALAAALLGWLFGGLRMGLFFDLVLIWFCPETEGRQLPA